MRADSTVNEIQNQAAILYRNLTGKPGLTGGEVDIVQSAIVDAYQDVLMEYGVDNFRFQEQDIEVDTVANQKYVDLNEFVYKVVTGSVRIPSEDTNLVIIDEISIFEFDPRDIETGRPTSWASINSGDPNVIRLRLYPTPDQAYTLKLKGLQLPTDVITNFPSHLMPAIKYKALSLSCLGLGVMNAKIGFDQEYENSIKQIKDGYDNDGPRHVGRTFIRTRYGSIESRIP